MFPRAIIHVDGDAFFASCEITKNPSLKGKPVVTGLEKGIVSSMSYEAKARGITRAMRIRDVRRICPEAIILESDFMLYAMYAKRMYSIVRRYTDSVEEYSIDECFGDLTDACVHTDASYEYIARRIQKELHEELDMTFSIGLSINKTLAKLASKWNKPEGFTIIPANKTDEYLIPTPVHALWGIGGSTSLHLRTLGIYTAHDLATKDTEWVRSRLDIHIQRMHAELNGLYIHGVDPYAHHNPSSVQHTRMFHRPSRNRSYILSQLSNHIEQACAKIRAQELFAGTFSFFLKTQQFTYHGADWRLPEPSYIPDDFLDIIHAHIDTFYKEGVLYRAAGVRLSNLTPIEPSSLDLFGTRDRGHALRDVFATVDNLSRRYGSTIVRVASSLHTSNITTDTTIVRPHVRKRLRIPFLGSVH